jgi:hypothetical protein
MWLGKWLHPTRYATDFRIVKTRGEHFDAITDYYIVQYRVENKLKWHNFLWTRFLKTAEEELKNLQDIAKYFQNKEWKNVEVI